ncbi:ATP-binding protein [Thermodesulfobacteriota bacterium]
MINKAKDTFSKKAFIVISIIVITSLHYLTATHIHTLHDIYQRLYYVPIICAAIWFGLKGGLSTSAIISVLYVGHIIFQWKMHPHVSLQKYLEILIFNLVALITGILSEREQQQKNKYQDTAKKLKESYEKLKKQSKEMIEIEEQLRRADKLTILGQISAELAHEIRNPLAAIIGTADIIKRNSNTEDKKYEFVEILVKETDRLNNVLNNILNFTSGDSDGSLPSDINELIKDAMQLFTLPFMKKKINVSLNLQDNLPMVNLEPEQFRQVLLNIMLNASQAMPNGGTFTITTEAPPNDDDKNIVDHVNVLLADTGIGIEKKDMEKLFTPFYSSKDEGTGLGLSISQKIIEKFDGNISVESALNEGTSFIINLPCNKKVTSE